MVFRDTFQEAGQRGFAVFVARHELGQDVFVLQHRSAEPGDEANVKSASDLPVSLISQLIISRCPWCGRKLADSYGRHLDDLRREELFIRLGAT